MMEFEDDESFDLHYFDMLHEASDHFMDKDPSYVDALLPDIAKKKLYNTIPVLFYLLNYTEVLEYLKIKDVDFFQKSSYRGTGLLSYAVTNCNDEVFKWMLQLYREEGDINEKNDYGITALMSALKLGVLDRAKMLIDAKASTTSLSNNNLTPLKQAFLCSEGQARAIKGMALVLATGDFRLEISDLIEDAKALKKFKILDWIEKNNLETISSYEKTFDFPENFDLYDLNLFLCASEKFIEGDTSEVDKLLPDVLAKKYYDDTPVLFYFTFSLEVLNYLKIKNVDFFQKTLSEKTGLLTYALLNRENDIFLWVLQFYAEFGDIDEINHKGMTALMISLKFGYIEQAKALIDAGARTEVQNFDNETAFIQAFYCLAAEDKAIDGMELIWPTADFSSEIPKLIESAKLLKKTKILKWLETLHSKRGSSR